ncbi:MAG: non-heme iron oxygenase ferredoxin subunit [Ktedonobacterales bacterium]|nr:non-heme iron oxygenase ferredoxin subunit [Ktedonobacterales bacterium]
MAIIEVGREEELPPGQAARVFAGNTPIAVFNAGGELYAIGDTCTHEDFPLSEGELGPDCTVECALHGSRFDLRTGKALSFPATGSAGSYPVWVEDGMIKIEVPDDL